MMMMCTYLVAPQQVPQILPHHPVTIVNRNLNPRSIAVSLYIVLGEGWCMWLPCQVMAILCRCSAKGSTSFTVQAETNTQPAFLGIRGFTERTFFDQAQDIKWPFHLGLFQPRQYLALGPL